MHFTYSDVIGTVGAAFIIIAYFLLQANIAKSQSYSYLCLNLTGAIMIMFSLFFTINKASVIIEIFWISISIFGLIKKRISTRKYENPSPRQ